MFTLVYMNPCRQWLLRSTKKKKRFMYQLYYEKNFYILKTNVSVKETNDNSPLCLFLQYCWDRKVIVALYGRIKHLLDATLPGAVLLSLQKMGSLRPNNAS